MGIQFRKISTTAVGVLAIMAGMGTPAFAEPITLTGKDGTNTIKGDLVGLDNGFYIIDTSMGRLKISESTVTCVGAECPVAPVDTNILVVGSETIGVGMMPLLLAGFANTKEAEVKITEEKADVFAASVIGNGGFGDTLADFNINSSGSSAAFLGLMNKATQIGMSSRRIEPDEARRISRAGGGNMIAESQEHVIAVDSLLVVVNQNNPVSKISMEDLDRIYSGQITNWSTLGGSNTPIEVYGREQGSGTGEMFEQSIFATSRNRRAPSVQAVPSNEEMAIAVNASENAIGFVGHAFQRGTKALAISSTCGITVDPSSFTVKAEEYPLQRRLYLYNREDNVSEATQDFLNFAISTDADSVISKSGFISLSVEQDTRKFQGERAFDVIESTVLPAEIPLMREMVVEVLQYDRLSTTFRFASGSSSLEAKALSDLERLIEFVNQISGDVEVSFVGFSDSDGGFEANRSLSLGRAQQVAAAVSSYAAGRVSNRVQFTSKGFGELAPAACNDTLSGKRTNRRVEVWIKRL